MSDKTETLKETLNAIVRAYSQRVVYVAGPFRGPNAWEIEENIRRAEALALDVWAAGYAAICPHANTRFYQGALPDHVWLDGDLAIVARCDAVLMMPDWKRSIGATEERQFAQSINVPVYESLKDLLAGTPPRASRGARDAPSPGR